MSTETKQQKVYMEKSEKSFQLVKVATSMSNIFIFSGGIARKIEEWYFCFCGSNSQHLIERRT